VNGGRGGREEGAGGARGQEGLEWRFKSCCRERGMLPYNTQIIIQAGRIVHLISFIELDF